MTYLWILMTVFFWGTSFAASKAGMGSLNPLHFLFLRLLFSAVIFTAVLILMPESKRKIQKEDIPRLFFLSLIGISGYFTIQYTALTITTTVNASLIIGMSPVFIALYMHFSGKEYLRKIQAAGIALSFAGIILVITGGNPAGIVAAGHFSGDMLMILNAVMLAVFTVSASDMVKKYNPFTVVAVINIIALFILMPVILTDNPFSEVSILHIINKIELKTCLAALYLAVFCTIIGYYGWYRGIRNIGAAKTSVFNYMNPLVAAVVSHFVFNEKFSVYTAAGTALVLTGVFMGSSISSVLKKGHAVEKT